MKDEPAAYVSDHSRSIFAFGDRAAFQQQAESSEGMNALFGAVLLPVVQEYNQVTLDLQAKFPKVSSSYKPMQRQCI